MLSFVTSLQLPGKLCEVYHAFYQWKWPFAPEHFFGKILETVEEEGLTIKPLKHNELPHNLQENALTIQTGPAFLLFAIPPANQRTTMSSLWKQYIVQEPHLSIRSNLQVSSRCV